MESVHETDWRLRRKRLGDEVRFVMRMEDIMRHVSNELWNRAWWWTAVWCSLLISIEHGGLIETIGCNLETKVRDFLLTIKQWTKHINDQHNTSQWHGRFYDLRTSVAIAHGRHERQGAEGAEGSGVRGGGVLLPRWGIGLGAVPLPKKLCNSSFQIVHFHAIWRSYFHVVRCVKTQA